jgi:hypothetical protein
MRGSLNPTGSSALPGAMAPAMRKIAFDGTFVMKPRFYVCIAAVVLLARAVTSGPAHFADA